jgi:GDPmannose 4,6-dehydratase
LKRLAVIVGSAGQDGTFLTLLLESHGYVVLGLKRGDLEIADPIAVGGFVATHKPSEVYFLAAHHHSSEDIPDIEGEMFRQSMRTHFDAPVNFLEAIASFSPTTRFFYAASSHVFGPPEKGMQDELTPLQPESVYAITKVAGMMACRRYRNVKGVFSSIGILFNHESPLRSPKFVTRKIAASAARIAKEGQGYITLGNLDTLVDWGSAADYVDAMHRILRTDQPGDYVIATGVLHSVRQFAEIAFQSVGLDYRNHVISKPEILMRHPPPRVGDSSRLRKETGWSPTVDFEEMVRLMVSAEMLQTQ